MTKLNAWLHPNHLTEDKGDYMASPQAAGSLNITDLVADLQKDLKWDWYYNPIYDSKGNKIGKISDDKGSLNNPKWWEYAIFFGALSLIL